MEATVEEQLIAQAQTLSPTQKQQVLDFMRSLDTAPRTVIPPTALDPSWERLIGSITPEDLILMEHAIEEGCE